MAARTEWYRDNLLVSTNPSLIQPAAVNAAFGLDMMYWLKPIDETLLKTMLDNSLCFGVYELPKSSADIAGRAGPRQIGLARLVTDRVSTAYLTDVYIMEEFQRKGIGKWLIQCVNEHVETWPEMRWTFLVTSDQIKFYEENLGMSIYGECRDGKIMSKMGPGDVQH
ncbi:related to GNAT family N-acetyltransferase [Phialocephala subalpina]|uniref:Related to GNAT family N-acetyltransferase n=1 Tax=Phialocephala subalpina TaxID=576137 RepID=A0A1L7WGR0_9HELO|nr:related to GNAT family N-acetyltransferase [Phialocephala subalpina]